MPPGKRKPRGDASDVTTDDVRRAPPVSVPKIRHTDSEMSSAEDGGSATSKKFKPGSPQAKRAAAAAMAAGAVGAAGAAGAVGTVGAVAAGAPKAVAGAAAGVSGGAVVDDEVVVIHTDASSAVYGSRRSRNRKKVGGMAAADGDIQGMKEITRGLTAVVVKEGVSTRLASEVLEFAAQYEEVLIRLIAENERLRGRLDVGAVAGPSKVALAGAAPAFAVPKAPDVPAAAPKLPYATKPVETWAVMVKGKGVPVTSKEVMNKVVEQVGPTLGVRVHEVRPTRDGGAVIRTPSVAERKKIVENSKFEEVGLQVSATDKLGPKVTVQRVHAEITPDEFMTELYELNLKGMLSPESYRRSVRLVNRPWRADGGPVNINLECTPRVAEHLRATGVYVKWFRFLVRIQEPVFACYRCLGFDHRVSECRMGDEVCRRCGVMGHGAPRCQNEIRCRNCAFKGLPANHLMMSMECPVYAAAVARANARH